MKEITTKGGYLVTTDGNRRESDMRFVETEEITDVYFKISHLDDPLVHDYPRAESPK